jgi:hypothetical protein
MPYASIAANFSKPLYVRLNLPPEVTLHFIPLVDNISDLANLLFAKLFHPKAWSDTSGGDDALA